MTVQSTSSSVDRRVQVMKLKLAATGNTTTPPQQHMYLQVDCMRGGVSETHAVFVNRDHVAGKVVKGPFRSSASYSCEVAFMTNPSYHNYY